MIPPLAYAASDAVRAAIASVGRTEDIRFSPDNRLLVLAGYVRQVCLILSVRVETTAAGPAVVLDDHLELASSGITRIHGLDFIDNRTLAIANRDGKVSIVRLPSMTFGGRHIEVEPLGILSGDPSCPIETPGSIAVRRRSWGKADLLVCNNYRHQVTRHTLHRWAGFRVKRNVAMLTQGLDIPDGIAVSHDQGWIAVSSHGTHDVKLFSLSESLGPWSAPAGILQDANYPHGLRFTADDRYIIVADAGGPVLRVYRRNGGWHGLHAPSEAVVVLDDATFGRGRINEEEGGPKGIDIDRANRVVAITCDEQPLAFFDLKSVIGGAAAH